MFTELFSYAQSSSIAMMLAVEGDKLRVTVQQKETKKGTALSLSVVGTPEELDAELPGAIAELSAAAEQTAAVTDQVRAQVEPGKPMAPKSTTPATMKQTAREQRSAKEPSKTERKQTCIAEYIKLAAENGGEIAREPFIKKALSGRTFEKLFDNWTKFKAAAERVRATAAISATAETSTTESTAPASGTSTGDDHLELPLGQSSAAADDAPWTGSDAAALDEETNLAAPAPVTETPPPAPVWTVALTNGTELVDATETRTLAPGDAIDHHGKTYQVVATSVEDGGHRYLVRLKLRSVVIDGTEDVIGSDSREIEVGDELSLNGTTHTVLSTTPELIRVLAPPPPPKVRKVLDDEGENVGSWTGDVPEEGSMIDVAGKLFTVMAFNEKAVFVEAFVASEVL